MDCTYRGDLDQFAGCCSHEEALMLLRKLSDLETCCAVGHKLGFRILEEERRCRDCRL